MTQLADLFDALGYKTKEVRTGFSHSGERNAQISAHIQDMQSVSHGQYKENTALILIQRRIRVR